ncbi:calcium-dependent mitochondrial ATP-magnesium/phosphate carrier protein 1 [Amaranthus tricolor]|uniref:calcium-dependent mitochondrial ATP-magnesium/phosphate carrier protein 1 n=1 Tax=Amaranthus tricolor TaxID=29722 RepID=UPI00258930C2|nr:calcium-dependent mitochondrial ATP-magnesium/phosphate carrier protein 1 [Amaranthus tricolor]XP_057520948.1 calcium-dependent mitochondrial ATP-magnesium/phosphate carrier protein 1 [Amaranthus tricolor]XP_057520949.1 calcium-dependent mitochondrial ATP-magnesium/phosphate carrier protein 1 [Amaranthus tricolor]
MVSGNDPVESLLNSIQVVFSPIEAGFRKATKEFELTWLNSKSTARNVDVLGHLNDPNGVNTKNNKLHSPTLKKKTTPPSQCTSNEDKRKGSSKKLPKKTIFSMLSPNCASSDYKDNALKERSKVRDWEKKDGSCSNCLQFAMNWSMFVNGFAQAFPMSFKLGKKRCSKTCDEEKNLYVCSQKSSVIHDFERKETKKGTLVMVLPTEDTKSKDGKHLNLELVLALILDQITHNLQKLDQGVKLNGERICRSSPTPIPNPTTTTPQSPSHFDHWKAVTTIIEGKKADMNVFLGNFNFARMGGAPSTLVGVTSAVKEDRDDSVTASNNEESGGLSAQKIASGLLNIPLSNVERLKSTLSTVSISELIELLPQLGRSSKDIPDKKKLFSVQEFFKYTEAEGRRFFEELDRDGDGQVNLEDLEDAMRKRKLPRRYAKEFLQRARSHLFAKSFGWKQFSTLMEQREATILRAYTSLCLSKSGTLQKSEILASLKNAGLPANEDNAGAMMRFLNADTGGSISYGHFRNFMMLLPSDRLQDDPRNVWFEAATVVPVAPPVEIPAGSVLRSALAGGLASGLSTSLLHPVDTIKTRVQTSTLSFPEVISRVPQIGVQGLYRGSLPAILGQFTSHGLRTGIFEATKLVLINFAPNLPELQIQSLASFCSTLLGTATRIPCEVLKQRLQAGLFDNVGEAIVGTWQQDGLKGFFRGTGVTLCREVPLYVAGMGLYAESKKLAQHLLNRELEPWETIVVGALSGGIAAVVTTPFDVLKTRMMTAPHGQPISASMLAFSILTHEGPLGFFKGAIPRFFWVAPLGAMNFAGYELAKNAMSKTEEMSVDEITQK